MEKDQNQQFLGETRQPIKDELTMKKNTNGNNMFIYTYQLGKKKDQ